MSGARLDRVRRVIAAGRRVADPEDPLGVEARAAIEAEGGLSPEGIALALVEHLETDPLPEHLEALLARAGAAPRCHVVLAANVCTAALRALAFAAAVAPTVAVRPSRRGPVLAVLLARALAEDPAFARAGGAVACVDAIAPEPGDEVHAYGSDAAVSAIAASVAPGVLVRGHGTGLGVAVVDAGGDLDAAARAVARDVVPFDQRGCLSPRAVLVEGGAPRAEGFARALHEALGDLGRRVPRGSLDAPVRAEIATYRASTQAVGEIWEGPGHLVGLDPSPRALLLPPAARVVHVVPASAAPAGSGAAVPRAAELLAPWARYITTVGADGGRALAAVAHALAPHARRARLGEMQRPPLDGPVDLRPW